MTNHGNRYAFGDLSVDAGRFRVERDGRPVVLEPKAFDLLILLIERQGQVVTKQEILERIWADTAVTDNALTRVVAQLRKAIGDDARAPGLSKRCPHAATAGCRNRTSCPPSRPRLRRIESPRMGH